MKITWDDLRIDFDENTSDKLIADWKWLIGENKTPVLVTSIGDIFLKDDKDKIYWLNVGEGTVAVAADNVGEFKEKLQDHEQVNHWFLVDLVAALKKAGLELDKGEIYSYIKLPVLGGDYTVDNFEVTSMEVHFSFAGQIHRQVKDLPDGTKINAIKFKPNHN
ncbi:T6SS immunity protein Tdi1 domain-containing protein [Ohtaekwangia kribbensis]|uniref:T6SS immunity protein Tdi1 domain-containing protein n=1 Tax=Ohtaekwangia kribbensis TaxID=688913 RepID=A0ABW3K1I8_9BACT